MPKEWNQIIGNTGPNYAAHPYSNPGEKAKQTIRNTLIFPRNFDVIITREQLRHDEFAIIYGVIPDIYLAELRKASECLRRSEYLHKIPGAIEGPYIKELSSFARGCASSKLETDIFDTLQVCWAHRSRAAESLAETIVLLERLMFEIAQRSLTLSFSSLIIKAGGANETPWHQDAAYDLNLDDSLPLLSGLNTWLPLTPVNDSSGCLCYLKGSQRCGLRPHNQGTESDSLALRVNENELSTEVCCAMSPGDVLVHLPTTIHRATRNDQAGQRVAFSFNFSALY